MDPGPRIIISIKNLKAAFENVVDDALDGLTAEETEVQDPSAFTRAVDELRRGNLGECLLLLSRASDALADLHYHWERAQRPDAR